MLVSCAKDPGENEAGGFREKRERERKVQRKKTENEWLNLLCRNVSTLCAKELVDTTRLSCFTPITLYIK